MIHSQIKWASVQAKQAVFAFPVAAVKQLNICWAQTTLNSLHTMSTKQWGALSLTMNVRGQTSRETQSMRSVVALGISRGRRTSNILDVLISYMNNFTKHFCKTVWSCSVCLRHDDDNIKWGWVGKVLWGSILPEQWSLLSKFPESCMEFGCVALFQGESEG